MAGAYAPLAHRSDLRIRRTDRRGRLQGRHPPPSPRSYSSPGAFNLMSFLSRASVMVSQVSRRSRPAHTRPGLETGAALRRLTAGVLARKESDPTHRPRYGREPTARIPGSPRLLGAARRGSEDVCGHGARFCGWPGLSRSRLRRSTARDRRAVKRAASAAAEGGAEGPTLTGRRHARQSCRLRDRTPRRVIAAQAGAGSGGSSWPAARRFSGRGGRSLGRP